MVLHAHVTPDMLKRDSNLLLHEKLNDVTALTAYDGLVGAAVDEGRLIITSPNQREIFNPSLGGDRQVFLRRDLMFGDDDPLQWPQPLLREYAHLACIRRRPQKEGILSVMWWCPNRTAFETDNRGVLTGIGKLSSTYLLSIKSLVLSALRRSQREIFKDSILVRQLAVTLEDLIYRLEHISSSYRKMQLGVRATQRVFLELTGLLDFLEIYKPVLTNEAPSTTIPKVARIIGAITSDLTKCHRLYLAKIPVWLVRPYTALSSIRIRTVVPVQTAQDLLILDPSIRPTYPSIFRGAYSVQMYSAFAQHVLGYFRYPDPFGSVRASPLVNAPAPPVELSMREIRAKQYSPYANRKKKSAALPGGRSKFEDPESPYLPPAIPSWRKALENVNIEAARFVYPQVIPSDLGYVFPEPASFMSIQSPDRQKVFFRTWLKYRSALLYRMSSGSSDARPMPNTVWRTLLGLEYITTNGSGKEGTRSQKMREVVKDFLQNCLEEEGVDFADTDHATITWDSKPFESLDKNEFEEILWELAELNFWFELLALDSRASTSEVDRQKLVSACFPRASNGGSLLIVDLGVANHGLASSDHDERQIFLQSLRKVMSSWRGDHPPIIDVEKYRWSHEELEELEKVLTAEYCKTFYNYFRRAPIVPRRLSHTAAPYRAPTPPITVVDPMPNIFYDTTVLAPMPPL